MELKFLQGVSLVAQQKGSVSNINILAEVCLEPIRILEHQLKSSSIYNLNHTVKLGYNSMTTEIVSDPFSLTTKPIGVVAQ